MAIDPAALNALTARWAAAKAELDDSQNRSKINYNNALDTLRRQNTQSLGNIQTNMSDRGLLHSGITAQQKLKQGDEYNRARAQKAQQQQLALSTVARKRLEADQAYNAEKGVLASEAAKEAAQLKLLRGM